MRPKLAVATVSGKAYYVIVDELKRRNIPFLSLTPFEPIPMEIQVVLTTEAEKHLIKAKKVVSYRDGTEIEALVKEVLQLLRGKGPFEKVIIGVDPGEVFGLAVLADGRVIETANCFSLEETLSKVENILRTFRGTDTASVCVKVGDGVPVCKEKLLTAMDKMLPSNVVLESVSEVGTNKYLNEAKHRRGVRDIVSAMKIAGRNGHIYQRGTTDESRD